MGGGRTFLYLWDTIPPMKKLYLLSMISHAVLSHAGGFEGSGVGSKALSMGGAFVALVDDWSAGFWNPAGYASQPKGLGVGASVDIISLRTFDGNGIANPRIPPNQSHIEQGDPFFQIAGEPTRFSVTDTTIHAVLPSLMVFKVWDQWALASGVFSPLGFAFDIKDTKTPGYRVSYESQGIVLNYNVSVARRLGERLSVGVGLNIVDAQLKKEAEKDTPLYSSRSTSDGRGQTLQAVVGVQARLAEPLTLGASYKSASNIKLEGTTVANAGFLPTETSRIVTTLHNPAVYMLGLALRPVKPLVFTLDWNGTDWRPSKVKADFDHQGQVLHNQDFDARWRFTHRVRFGADYKHEYGERKALSVRGGYTWDPSAIPESAVSVTNLVDVSRNVYTAGLSWALYAWELTGGFAYASGKRTVSGVDYKKVDRLLTFSISYRGL